MENAVSGQKGVVAGTVAIDELDLQLLDLLQRGYDNKHIAKTTEIPLSTIQRRTRLIFKRGLATSRIEQDYDKLGYKKGFLCIRLRGGRIESIADKLSKINEILSISANIGSFGIYVLLYILTQNNYGI